MKLERLSALAARCLMIGLLGLMGPALHAEPANPTDEVNEPLAVMAGGQRSLDFPKALIRVAVGSEEIAGIKVISGRQILIQGKQPGVTSLLVWLQGEKQAQARTLVVNRGGALDPELAKQGLKLKYAGQLASLSGSSDELAKLHAARQQATQGDEKNALVDTSSLPFGSEVQIDVRVVEFSRKVLHKAGLSMLSNKSGFSFGAYAPGSLNKAQLANGVITAEANVPIAQALNLLVGNASNSMLGVISVLEGNGFARTLAQPTLVAQSGRNAEFLAGGEFPVPVPQALGQTTIQFKPYGIRLQVSPTILAANRIALTVSPEVSDLNFENGITINGVSVPSLTTRRATTSIELGHGESFVIGGLVSQSLMRNVNKVPGLGDLPVLGAFFKSISVSREDKELLFVVTPRLVRPLAAGTELGSLPGDEMSQREPGILRDWLLPDGEVNDRYTGFSR